MAIATALPICQIGYVNADFVGYSAIAHRLLKDPRTSITGYWSPLYSWCMASLIYLGVDDLIAGRVILMVGGVIYLLEYLGWFADLTGPPTPRPRDNHRRDDCGRAAGCDMGDPMLDPDLLADGLLFCYFYAVLDPCCRKGLFTLGRSPGRSCLPGQTLHAPLHAASPAGNFIDAMVGLASFRAGRRLWSSKVGDHLGCIYCRTSHRCRPVDRGLDFPLRKLDPVDGGARQSREHEPDRF